MQPQSRIVDLLGEGLKGYYGVPLWVTSLPQTCPQKQRARPRYPLDNWRDPYGARVSVKSTVTTWPELTLADWIAGW